MDAERQEQYDALDARIGNTPLIEYAGELPHKNRIFIKMEADNPFGSHYDRVYAALFRHHEKKGDITPGQKVIETTSGSAGVSFAAIGKELGYECIVAMPGGGEVAREEAIKEYLSSDDHLILTPARDYVAGFPQFITGYLLANRDAFFLNHSMGRRGRCNEVTLDALGKIRTEFCRQVPGSVGYFVPAIGNGSSVLGPGRGLVTNTFGFETFQSAYTFEMMKPGLYEEIFGIKPGTLSRHQVPGTSFNGIDFPHIKRAVNYKVLKDVFLVGDEKMAAEYQELTGRDLREVIAKSSILNGVPVVFWDQEDPHMEGFGRSTKAGLAAAKFIANSWLVGYQNIVILGYDKPDRYDE